MKVREHPNYVTELLIGDAWHKLKNTKWWQFRTKYKLYLVINYLEKQKK